MRRKPVSEIICPDCGRKDFEYKNGRCYLCYMKEYRKYMKKMSDKHRAKYKDLHLCLQCGAKLDENDKRVLCEACRKKQHDYWLLKQMIKKYGKNDM